jgi:hypothetical protein
MKTIKLTKTQLKQIIKEEIQLLQGTGDFSWVTLREMELLEEFNYNIENTYPVINELPFNIEFKDGKGRLNVTKGKLNNNFIEIKLYWIDSDGNVKMDTPDGITPKTMNTHMSNIINKFLPNYDEFLIRPNDDIRFRLFQLILNKYLNKNEWKLELYLEKREIFITKK